MLKLKEGSECLITGIFSECIRKEGEAYVAAHWACTKYSTA